MRGITNLFVFCILLTSFFISSTSALALTAKSSSTVVNSQLSAEQIKQAAENGDPDAQYALGYMFYYGKGGLPRNVDEARRWIGKAADNKQPQAMRAQKLMLAAEQKNGMNRTQYVNNSHRESSLSSSVAPNNYAAHNEALHHQALNFDKRSSLQREKEIEREAANEISRQSSHESLSVRQEPIAKTASVNSSEKKLLAVPSNYYTVQLLAGENKEGVERVVNDNDLKPKAAVYHTYHNAKLMYVLIYGQYKTKHEADVIATKMSKQLHVEPWVKSYASVKKSITSDNN